MNGQVKYAISNYLLPSNNISEYHFYNSISVSSALANKDSIVKLINKGTGFINYTGHGDANSWLHLDFKMDTSKFKNKDMYPFIISNACQTARFSSATSLGNTMVLTPGKGAIGFIGCSNDSYWDEDFYWSVGATTVSSEPTYLTTGLGAYDRLFHTHGESASNWYFTMGQINYAGNLAVSASTTVWKKYYWETYNLIGDPSVIPILGKPGLFNVSLPDTLPNGIKSISLNVDPFAYVAISHFDKLWDASYSSPSGSVVLDLPGLSNDSCLVVISGQNKMPVIKTIRISNVKKEFINLTSTSINDIQGNGNGLADFGEKIYLNLKLSNLGLSDASGLYAKISSTSGWVTINSDSTFIGTLQARSEVLITESLGLTISGNAPNMGRITLNLMLKDAKTTKNYAIDIVVRAPELQIINCVMNDSISGNGDHIADPGETFNLIFKVRNKGSSNISGQFNVVSVNPEKDITILEKSVKSGVLKFGETTDIPITVKLSETVASGSSISITSTLDCSPYILNKEFSFRVGRIRESFEAQSFSIFPWINLSSVPWIATGSSSYDGSISARSGAIPNNGTTTLLIRSVYATADSVKFYYKVSSEAGYDFFSFKLNGIEILKKSGEIDWTKNSIAVPAGLNKMEWIYYKDGNTTGGSDCAWIDMIDFAGTSQVKYIQKDLKVARVLTPEEKNKYGLESVTVKVLNLGKEIINGFNLAYELNDHTPVKQYFENPVIPYGDSVTVTFKTKADFSKFGIYKIVAYGYSNNDDYILNDTMQVKFENTEINDSIRIYPNPFTDQFTINIRSATSENVQISITNMSGVRLYNVVTSINVGINTIIISDLKLLPSVYYLNIRGTKINKTSRLIKLNK
jgi:hypothetical protein